jgi:hypothetical protein
MNGYIKIKYSIEKSVSIGPTEKSWSSLKNKHTRLTLYSIDKIKRFWVTL